MKACQRGSGLGCCVSSSIIIIVSSQFLARNKDRNNIPIANRSSTGKAYSLNIIVGDMTRKRRYSLLTSDETTSQRAPSMTVALQQFVGFRRAFASGRVVREFRSLLTRPRLQDGSDQSPLIFDLISPDKERLVALHHVKQ